jgi:protein-tyrosine phosphatase
VGYIDLHSHVLPALDDGAVSPESSRAMLAALARLGFEAVAATPHQKAGQFLPSLDAVGAAFEDARAVAGELGLRLALAAENYWDDVLFGRWRAGNIPSYDGGRAFLFEIPTEELPVRLEETLFQMVVGGKLPVMAHPERYRPFREDTDRLARLGRQVALVVDLGAVGGYHGWGVSRAARRLLTDRIAHAAASDLHAPSDAASAAAGIAWIKKKLGPDAARRLLDDNPRAILAGQLPDA